MREAREERGKTKGARWEEKNKGEKTKEEKAKEEKRREEQIREEEKKESRNSSIEKFAWLGK